MSNGVETSSEMHDSSTESIEINNSREPETNHQKPEFTSSEVTHQSERAHIKLMRDPILRQVERLCPLFVEKEPPELEWKQRSYRLLSR